mgnify:FL=1
MDAYLKDQFNFTGVKAALLVEQSILVILRDNKPDIPWPNTWELPGGGREGQETPLECLQREVWEELGLALKEESIIWSKIYPSMLDKDRSAVFVVGRISQEQYREIRFGDEGQEFKLMPIEDFIKAEGVIPQLQERFKDYLVGKETEKYMDKWQELTIEVNREVEEAASNILIESGSQGVAIDDSADYLENADRFGELYPEVEQVETVKITAYYPESADIEAITKQVNERLAELTDFGLETGDIHLATQELVEEDWAENWKKYYEPARITHDLTIVPSWTDYEASVGEKIIKLDPGMAFGTGTHPTTKMSLFALEQVLRGGETVIDVGTGSGVLSIASSLLGAKEIYAYDLDDVAVRVAQENIDMNPDMENIHVAAGDLLKGVTQEADVIVANILADILIHLTEDAYRLVKDEGYLIMSGIISEKWDMVRESAEKAGFFLETHMVQGEWNACVFKKTDDISGVIGG